MLVGVLLANFTTAAWTTLQALQTKNATTKKESPLIHIPLRADQQGIVANATGIQKEKLLDEAPVDLQQQGSDPTAYRCELGRDLPDKRNSIRIPGEVTDL